MLERTICRRFDQLFVLLLGHVDALLLQLAALGFLQVAVLAPDVGGPRIEVSVCAQPVFFSAQPAKVPELPWDFDLFFLSAFQHNTDEDVVAVSASDRVRHTAGNAGEAGGAVSAQLCHFVDIDRLYFFVSVV
jgi:hypothetical protein